LSALRLAVNALSCLLEFLIEFLTRLAEFAHALSKAPGKLWQLFCAEKYKDND
jgi:hypothetical protein